MITTRLHPGHLFTLALYAAGFTFLFMFFYTCAISALPRPMQGESVTVPWNVCVTGFVVLPIVLPFLLSLNVLRDRRHRALLLLFLVLFTAFWFEGLDLVDLLSKAWRRGF